MTKPNMNFYAYLKKEQKDPGIKYYFYLVENKSNGSRYVMMGNLKDSNMGCGRYLYEIVGDKYEYARNTPYGFRSNISTGIKYNSKYYRVVHQIAV